MKLEELKENFVDGTDVQPPEGYFESLSAQVISQWEHKKNEPKPLVRTLWPWLAAASILAGVWFFFPSESLPQDQLWSQLTDEEIVDYYVLEEGVDDWMDDDWMDDTSEDELVALLIEDQAEIEIVELIYKN